jgi:hypothetical protein
VKPTLHSRSSLAVFGLLLSVALAFGPLGCEQTVWVFPENGTVQQGPFDVQVYWSPDMVPSTLQVAMNDEKITDSMSPAAAAGVLPDVEIAGVVGMRINPFPGKKLLTAQMLDGQGLPHLATSIFTATSITGRAGFAGGHMVFEPANSFTNSALQIPGVDMDLGVSEIISAVLPVSGLFPAGDSAFPVSSDPLPVLFGIFPKMVTFDVDDTIPNGISLSPVELALSFDFNPANPADEGKLCRASFVMEGTILPVQAAISGLYHGAMVQSLREVSMSMVTEGECVSRFSSAPGEDVMTFNYLARK